MEKFLDAPFGPEVGRVDVVAGSASRVLLGVSVAAFKPPLSGLGTEEIGAIIFEIEPATGLVEKTSFASGSAPLPDVVAGAFTGLDVWYKR